jgi:hypothetical protein
MCAVGLNVEQRSLSYLLGARVLLLKENYIKECNSLKAINI